MMLGKFDEPNAVGVSASGGRGRAHAVLSDFLWLVFFLLSCGPAPSLRSPYVILRFAKVDLVVEGANSPQDAVSVGKGDISFSQVGGSSSYGVQGEGAFTIKGHAFTYTPPILKCDCQGFDTSKGAVVVRGDGTLVPANLLPLIAR